MRVDASAVHSEGVGHQEVGYSTSMTSWICLRGYIDSEPGEEPVFPVYELAHIKISSQKCSFL